MIQRRKKKIYLRDFFLNKIINITLYVKFNNNILKIRISNSNNNTLIMGNIIKLNNNMKIKQIANLIN